MKIVTVACDRYADIAPAYEYLLRKNWPDCPYPLIYVTNSKKLEVEGSIHYIEGEDIKFGWRLRTFIENHYNDDYLLLMMIDYLVVDVDTRLIARAHELIQLPEIGHVRLRPKPGPQLSYDKDFGKIKKLSRYSLSLQPGIWESKVIYDLIRDRESAHTTEVQGSSRTDSIDKVFLCSHQIALDHVNYYSRGRPAGGWLKLNTPPNIWTDAAKSARRSTKWDHV